jgi:DNA-binding Lrp family transcriptional regulator
MQKESPQIPISKNLRENEKAVTQKLSDLDIYIIKTLLKNSRIGLQQIAKEYKTTVAKVTTRFNRLKRDGIITGSTVIVDLAHFGVECDGMLYININQGYVQEFIHDMQNNKGFMLFPQRLNQKCNFKAWSPVKNIRDLENFKKCLKQHSAVVDVETRLWTYMKVTLENIALEG